MIYLAYCSSAVKLMDSTELIDLLKTSRDCNLRAGITGMLLYRDGSFMQVLEGEAEAVLATYGRITADSRHRNIIKLIQAKIAARNFDRWTMGFCDIGDLTDKERAAYSPFLSEPFDAEHYSSGSAALKLLQTFRKIAD